ncbi:hypothetical protein CEXT_569251 [Caerostris extrusa]|uniref:Uncharacterized protein n=1 Tax=Caerostris extrusa TaxID=172846 RepID=A0AAV4XJ03_CAEEX|nr:hypothetical protein CEXT_569251 [Caerostris extrusa]
MPCFEITSPKRPRLFNQDQDGDESWCHDYHPKIKQHSIQWKTSWYTSFLKRMKRDTKRHRFEDEEVEENDLEARSHTNESEQCF